MKTLPFNSVPAVSNALVYFEGWPQDSAERTKIIACLIGVNYCRATQQQTDRDEHELRKSFEHKEWEVITQYAAQHPIQVEGLIEPIQQEFKNVYQLWNLSSQKCAALLDFIQQNLFCVIGSNTAHSKLAVYAKNVTTKAEVSSLQLNETMGKLALILEQVELNSNTGKPMTLMVIAECAKAALETQARGRVLPPAFQQWQSSSSSSSRPDNQRVRAQETSATPLLRDEKTRVMPTFQPPVQSASSPSVVITEEGCCCVIL